MQALARTGYLAKFRTGGVNAELYPDEAELSATVLTAVRAGVPFKATAGLHHAVRNTDPRTRFEQHGFLNLLVATAAAQNGAGVSEMAAVLADRSGGRLADRVRAVPTTVRDAFRSFGTCSISDPLRDLASLDLLEADLTKGLQ